MLALLIAKKAKADIGLSRQACVLNEALRLPWFLEVVVQCAAFFPLSYTQKKEKNVLVVTCNNRWLTIKE